ncbi:MAG: histidinol dehydrogenase, partial [Burkholderiales bacterium]|nr:histidinol dehydrogenase [Burkholderiales bacterium]
MPVQLRQLDTCASDFEAEFAKLRHWSEEADHAIEERVAAILADVKTRGDAAVLEYTNRFDGMAATSVSALELTRAELKAAFDAITPAQRSALEAAARRVRSYHERQLEACG